MKNQARSAEETGEERDAHISSIYFSLSLIKQTSSMPRAAAGRQRPLEPSSAGMLKPGRKGPSVCAAPGCSDTAGCPSMQHKGLVPVPARGHLGQSDGRGNDGRCCLCCISPSDLPQQIRLQTGAIDPLGTAQGLGWGEAIKSGSFSEQPPPNLLTLDSHQGQGRHALERGCSGQCQRI